MEEPEEFRKILASFSPDMISQSFRQPVLLLWMALPPGNRNVDTLKANVREQYERVLSSFESDAQLLELFGRTPDAEGNAEPDPS